MIIEQDHIGDADNGAARWGGELSDPWMIDELPIDVVDAPLDFLFAEHRRQRQAAMAIILVADGEFDRDGVARLIDFLEGDFALHTGDEELGFFPILQAACTPEDDMDALIERLIGEHENDDAVCAEAVHILKARLADKPLERADGSKLRAFAEHLRQHLAVENAVLLPIARVRLDEGALCELSTILKRRHAGSSS